MPEIITAKSMAILHASLRWQSDFAGHEETLYIPLNVWRELEIMPPALIQALAGEKAGAVVQMSFPDGSLVPVYREEEVKYLPLPSFAHGHQLPREGRFYPRGFLLGYSQNTIPFRSLAVRDGIFAADFNHPLAPHPLELELTVREVRRKRADTGGVCHDWLQILCNGPRYAGAPVRAAHGLFCR